MFSVPAPEADINHPFERECVEAGIVLNQWGQRVTSMAAIGGALYIGTSAKGPIAWDAETYPFITPEVYAEYGRVHRITMPGHLSAPITWTSGPTELVFEVHPSHLRILQDGAEIGRAPLPDGHAPALNDIALQWGGGLYGAFSGEIIERHAE
jgi:hypothetical protein